MTRVQCDSCSMPVESGSLCQYCSDDDGALGAFDEIFERMVQWTRREHPELDHSTAEAQTIKFMSGMPAWANHEAVKARLS